jgi:hypothetical protein
MIVWTLCGLAGYLALVAFVAWEVRTAPVWDDGELSGNPGEFDDQAPWDTHDAFRPGSDRWGWSVTPVAVVVRDKAEAAGWE